MWGYSIGAAKHNVTHKLVRDFQAEPGAQAHNLKPDFWKSINVFHYTYGIEYRMDGRPQGVNQIGEWSLDKRHYGGAYPPRDLEPPPVGANAAACWLVQFRDSVYSLLSVTVMELGLVFESWCAVKTPWSAGKWGLQTQSRTCDAQCVQHSFWLEFSGALHSLTLSSDGRALDSTRIGDGEKVALVRQ
ncbi:hypothetical protein T492DRAFT_832455 [Pavlovales sp. CCMP2436]|nr:hypothetical protein T492DRAFT_832455 [Pavlovales sp. CCMP2436]